MGFCRFVCVFWLSMLWLGGKRGFSVDTDNCYIDLCFKLRDPEGE